mmetsp:Transcript_7982/g.13713  ORF Transcript_7982/g.13713 Transcript_7982/m.13713 type:complete len:108 (-) Transcript_7982:1511-1834(-)|eukprot:CAMPEP_0116546976 /NCGR_PEP_ID=MMETSP0397-20121206/3525_1 /TAXON_ID=216820 /ORGANISM="Cyclophora tenuis, Strain ECT3854" /LENGTH=107 /DNA_ID=CAMNT_0004071465 /DNA_START=337 /DNA_END=660 /DNA_ORIENTATION=-
MTARDMLHKQHTRQLYEGEEDGAYSSLLLRSRIAEVTAPKMEKDHLKNSKPHKMYHLDDRCRTVDKQTHSLNEELIRPLQELDVSYNWSLASCLSDQSSENQNVNPM